MRHLLKHAIVSCFFCASTANALPLNLQWGESKDDINANWPLVEVSPYSGYSVDRVKAKDQKTAHIFDSYYLQILPENGLCSMMIKKKIKITYSGKGLADSYNAIRGILKKEFGRSVALGMKDEEIQKMDDELLLSIRTGTSKIKEGWSRNVGSRMVNGIKGVYLAIDEVDPFESEATFSITYDGNTPECKIEMTSIKDDLRRAGSGE